MALRSEVGADFRRLARLNQRDLKTEALQSRHWVTIETLQQFSSRGVPPICLLILMIAAIEQDRDGSLSTKPGLEAEVGVVNRFLHLANLAGAAATEETQNSLSYLFRQWEPENGPPTYVGSGTFDAATSAYSAWIISKYGREAPGWAPSTDGGSPIGSLIVFATDPQSRDSRLIADEIRSGLTTVGERRTPDACQWLFAASWAVSSGIDCQDSTLGDEFRTELRSHIKSRSKLRRISLVDQSYLIRAACLLETDDKQLSAMVNKLLTKEQVLTDRFNLYEKLNCGIALLEAAKSLGDKAPPALWRMPFWLPATIGPPIRISDVQWLLRPHFVRSRLVSLDIRFRIWESAIGSIIGALIAVSLFDSEVPRLAANAITASNYLSVAVICMSAFWCLMRTIVTPRAYAQGSWFSSSVCVGILLTLLGTPDVSMGGALAVLVVVSFGFVWWAFGLALLGLTLLDPKTFEVSIAIGALVLGVVSLIGLKYPLPSLRLSVFFLKILTVLFFWIVIVEIRVFLVFLLLLSVFVDMISLTLDENGWLRRIRN